MTPHGFKFGGFEFGGCELCGGGEFSTRVAGVRDYLSGETFAVRCCAGCGLCATEPQVPDDAIERYYPPRYRTDRQKYSGGTRVKLRAAAVEKHLPKDSRGGDAGHRDAGAGAAADGRGPKGGAARGRLLDLGCGTGAFALEMQRRGWTVAVTELNDAVLDDLRRRGMEAKRPDEAMRDGFAQPFDVITCWHVLEHVEHPVALANWARANLRPGGIFQVTVPNLDSWQARMFGSAWLHLDPPRHRYHFTPRTLETLLGRCGFDVVARATFALEYDLFGWMQSALNRVCEQPNVLFEKLTARGDARPTLPPRDVAVSYALAPFVGAASLLPCFASWPLRQGGTLTFTCRATGG